MKASVQRILMIILIFSVALFGQVNWTHITVGSAPSSTRPVICSDPLGNIHVAWTSDDPYGELLQYATNQYGGWGYQKEVYGSSSYQVYNPSITADRQGFAYIVFRFYSSSYRIKYATNRNITSSNWNIVTQMYSGHYHESSIEVDRNFNTHVFAHEDSYGLNAYYQSLDSDHIVMENITQFFYTAIDPGDILHFLGYNDSGIFYTNNSSGSWSSPDTIDQLDISVYHPSITADNDGDLHVVFESDNGLYYMNNKTGDWSLPELITGGSGIFPNIVVDENDKAHVAWYTTVDWGTLYYSNNVNGSWLTPSYVTTINEDNSSATEDVAHVESKIALDTRSNSVYIVYVDDGNYDVKVARTTDFNLQSPKSTDTTTVLTVNSAVDPPDTLSISNPDTIDLLGFTISDAGGDGLPTKISQLIIQSGSEMSTDIGFSDVFSQIILNSSDGASINGNIYSTKIFFGTLDAVWKEVPEGESINFTVSGILNQPLMNMDGKSIDLKINGSYDIIIDTTGSRFAGSNQDVSTGGILFQVVPDHFEFANLGNDFYDENLVEGWWMQLNIVDANGVIATSVSDVEVTLSAVKLDGVTPAPHALQSTEGLTKTLVNGVAQWTNLSYPDTGQIRILATSSILSSASDTITIMPYHKTLVIGSDTELSNILNQLNIEHDYYSENNYAFPSEDNLSAYDNIIMAPSYIFAWYIDSTAMKNFLESGSDTSTKSIMAIGGYGLGNYTDTPFANRYFGGVMSEYFSHDTSDFQGVDGDPITDGLTLTVSHDWTGKITQNQNLSGSSVILTYPEENANVGIKNDADIYRTVWLSPNFSVIIHNTSFDSLIDRTFRWFKGESQPAPQPPMLSNLPDINMLEDTPLIFAISSWYDYVTDADTPDDELNWEVSQGSHIAVSLENDSLFLQPEENFNGNDTLTVIVSDNFSTDTASVTVAVAPVNDPPIISPLPDTTINEDTVLKMVVSVYDSDGDSPVLSAVSDTDVVAISFNMDTLVASPIPNWNGTAAITVSATDNDTTIEESFNLTVLPENDPPVISGFPDSVVFRADSSVILELNSYVTDVDNPDSTLKWSVSGNDFVIVDINDTTNVAVLSTSVDRSGIDTLLFTVSDTGSAADSHELIVHVFPYLGVDNNGEQIPEVYSLSQNYPNPFNPHTIIEYQLPVASDVELRIYDILGRKIRTVIKEKQNPGYYRIIWDGRTDEGKLAPSGLYFYRIVANDFVATKGMVIMR